MDKTFESKYHSLEETHWWFQARREFIGQCLEHRERSSVILDIGCSGGVMMQYLRKLGFFDVHGIDVSDEAIRECRAKGLTNVSVMSADKLSFQDQMFDAVIASDVIEHIENDLAVLKECRRILKPGGFLLVFVPAFQWLWSGHDTVNEHKRRYTRRQLLEKIRQAGFSVERTSFWNFCLFLPVVMVRALSKIGIANSPGQDHLKQTSSFVNSALCRLIHLENVLLKRINLPWGVSVWAQARRRD